MFYSYYLTQLQMDVVDSAYYGQTAATLAVGQESESVGGGRVEGSGRQRRANRCELQVFIDRLSLVFVVTGTVA